MKKASDLYQTVTDFLKEVGYRYDEVPTDNPDVRIARADLQGENGAWRFYVEAHEDTRTVICYSILDTRIPKERRQAVADFLTRANFALILGNFEMDFDDGETRYKTSLTVGEDRLTAVLLGPLVAANTFTFDRYLPGLMRVAFGDKKPEDAISEIEGAAPTTG